jgi:UTP:GlnB (protein PII) uridylyltransferase
MIAVLGKGLKEKDLGIEDLKQRVSSLEERVNDLYLIIKNKQQQRQQNLEAELHKEIVEEIIEE